ncbi:coenzyme F430 synthase [Methanosarcina sp. Mfa9]|uniref:coenzyme F430 synthase n=1 Tax=Methanosarcina sp. Mfa9 TaxID=3439063 RepID=UPI003F8532DB
MDLDRKKIAVLDLTHGGIPISIKLAELGAEVSAVDVYNTVDSVTLSELEDKHGIRTSREPLPVGAFDLLAAPVHLDPAYPMLAEARNTQKPVLSHHRLVGIILEKDPRLAGTRTIEITGVKAKTSTASLLADMLSRKLQVVLHTSRGLEAWKGGMPSEIRKGLSITPGSILVAIDRTFEAGIRPDFFIFEISIGGTGNADLGILTTLTPDYGIANNSSLAGEAKLQLVRTAKTGTALVLNVAVEKALENTGEKIPEAVKKITFRDPFYPESGESADFVLETEEGNIHCLCRGQKLFTARLQPGYNSLAYRTAFVAASAAALELGVESRTMVEAIEEFRGLAGRMQEKELEGKALIDNSNSGMDIRSAEKALEYALLKKKDERKQKIFIVLGEEAAQVCEGLPPEAVQGFVEKYGKKFERIVLVGERMRAIKAGNVTYAASLPEGLSEASKLAGKADIIISSVKCFR